MWGRAKSLLKRRLNQMDNDFEIIGIDHGWSMVKTSSQVFIGSTLKARASYR